MTANLHLRCRSGWSEPASWETWLTARSMMPRPTSDISLTPVRHRMSGVVLLLENHCRTLHAGVPHWAATPKSTVCWWE